MRILRVIFAGLALLGLGACGKKKTEITPVQRKTAAHHASEAQFAVSIRDYARAESLYAQAAALCPDTGDYWLSLGAMRMRLADRSGAKKAYGRAVEAFDDAYKSEPPQVEAALQKVYALLLLGKTDEARAQLAAAAKKHPENRTVSNFVRDGQLDRILAQPAFKELAL